MSDGAINHAYDELTAQAFAGKQIPDDQAKMLREFFFCGACWMYSALIMADFKDDQVFELVIKQLHREILAFQTAMNVELYQYLQNKASKDPQ